MRRDEKGSILKDVAEMPSSEGIELPSMEEMFPARQSSSGTWANRHAGQVIQSAPMDLTSAIVKDWSPYSDLPPAYRRLLVNGADRWSTAWLWAITLK